MTKLNKKIFIYFILTVNFLLVTYSCSNSTPTNPNKEKQTSTENLAELDKAKILNTFIPQPNKPSTNKNEGMNFSTKAILGHTLTADTTVVNAKTYYVPPVDVDIVTEKSSDPWTLQITPDGFGFGRSCENYSIIYDWEGTTDAGLGSTTASKFPNGIYDINLDNGTYATVGDKYSCSTSSCLGQIYINNPLGLEIKEYYGRIQFDIANGEFPIFNVTSLSQGDSSFKGEQWNINIISSSGSTQRLVTCGFGTNRNYSWTPTTPGDYTVRVYHPNFSNIYDEISIKVINSNAPTPTPTPCNGKKCATPTPSAPMCVEEGGDCSQNSCCSNLYCLQNPVTGSNSCGFIGGGNPTPTPTATAIPSPVPTATPTVDATPTPIPSSTATPTPNPTKTPKPNCKKNCDEDEKILKWSTVGDTLAVGSSDFTISGVKNLIGNGGTFYNKSSCQVFRFNARFTNPFTSELPSGTLLVAIVNSKDASKLIQQNLPLNSITKYAQWNFPFSGSLTELRYDWYGKYGELPTGADVPAGSYSAVLMVHPSHPLPPGYGLAPELISEVNVINDFFEPEANDITALVVKEFNEFTGTPVGHLDGYPKLIKDDTTPRPGIIAEGERINIINILERDYCGSRSNWYKMKGKENINLFNGLDSRYSEVHWYEYRRKKGGKFYTLIKVSRYLE